MRVAYDVLRYLHGMVKGVSAVAPQHRSTGYSSTRCGGIGWQVSHAYYSPVAISEDSTPSTSPAVLSQGEHEVAVASRFKTTCQGVGGAVWCRQLSRAAPQLDKTDRGWGAHNFVISPLHPQCRRRSFSLGAAMLREDTTPPRRENDGQ